MARGAAIIMCPSTNPGVEDGEKETPEARTKSAERRGGGQQTFDNEITNDAPLDVFRAKLPNFFFPRRNDRSFIRSFVNAKSRGDVHTARRRKRLSFRDLVLTPCALSCYKSMSLVEHRYRTEIYENAREREKRGNPTVRGCANFEMNRVVYRADDELIIGTADHFMYIGGRWLCVFNLSFPFAFMGIVDCKLLEFRCGIMIRSTYGDDKWFKLSGNEVSTFLFLLFLKEKN